MLRASIEYNGQTGDLRAVTEGAKGGDPGLAHGDLLTRFTEAAVRGEPAELATARDALREAVGSAALVDTAGVIANFERMTRIADGTGIPLDAVMMAASGDLREELGLDAYRTRRHTQLGALGRLAAPLLRGLASLGLRAAGRRARRA